MKSIRWFKRPLWQAEAFHLLGARKGSGKGTYVAWFAVQVLDNGMAVVFIAREDSPEIDVKPRLVAAGMRVDEDRAYFIRGDFRLPDDIDALRDNLLEIEKTIGVKVGLVVFDPVNAFIGRAKTDNDGEVRGAIDGLNSLAHELDMCVIGIRNVSVKPAREGASALSTILGSSAWVDVPRAVVMIAPDDQEPDVRHIQVVAGNRSATGVGEKFRIEAVQVDGLDEPVTSAVMLGASDKSIEDLIARMPRGRAGTRTGDARRLILDLLEDEGEQLSDELDRRVAEKTGLAASTARDARNQLSRMGLVRSRTERTDGRDIKAWRVSRTRADRPPELARGAVETDAADARPSLQLPRGGVVWGPSLLSTSVETEIAPSKTALTKESVETDRRAATGEHVATASAVASQSRPDDYDDEPQLDWDDQA
jgi:hypothetical protein